MQNFRDVIEKNYFSSAIQEALGSRVMLGVLLAVLVGLMAYLALCFKRNRLSVKGYSRDVIFDTFNQGVFGFIIAIAIVLFSGGLVAHLNYYAIKDNTVLKSIETKYDVERVEIVHLHEDMEAVDIAIYDFDRGIDTRKAKALINVETGEPKILPWKGVNKKFVEGLERPVGEWK